MKQLTYQIRNKLYFAFVEFSDNLIAHKEFFGLYGIENTEAQTLVNIILDVLTWLNLSIKNLRGQCYDGASSMSGLRSGVAKKISDLESRAVYTHCYSSLVEFSMHGYYKEFQSYARSPRYYQRDNQTS